MLCFLIIVCQFAHYLASPDCVFGDSTCWTKFYNSISPKIADGIPELGTERLDTMNLDLIEMRKNEMHYKSTNNTLTGLKGSIIDDISNYKDLKVMVLVFRANLTLRGDYTINGSLFSIPITGNGEIKILLNKCRFEMIMPYEVIKDKNGKSRINLKSNLFSAHAYGGVNYFLENFLPGQSDMSKYEVRVDEEISTSRIRRLTCTAKPASNLSKNQTILSVDMASKARREFFSRLKGLIQASSIQQKKCFISDKECLTARAQENVAIFAQGFPDMNIERLDPLRIEHIKKEKDGLEFEGKNIEKEGFRNSIIDELRVDMASKVMGLAFHADLILKGQYKVDGFLFSMPISGEGVMLITKKHEYVEMNMPFEIFLDPYGRTFMDLKNFTYNFGVKDGATFRFDNLFYGDQEKSDQVHTYINENWKLVVEVFGPILVDDIYTKIFTAIATFMRSKPLQDLQF